jgi:hypothetical protein
MFGWPPEWARVEKSSQALEFRTPLFPHLVPPAIMVWIFVWKYIFEPFIHILQHFVLQLSRSTNWNGLAVHSEEQAKEVPKIFPTNEIARNKICSADLLNGHEWRKVGCVPAIMVWIFVWKYIFEPFIHISQHFVLQLSRSTNFCF